MKRILWLVLALSGAATLTMQAAEYDRAQNAAIPKAPAFVE